jgi:hypothetical protein
MDMGHERLAGYVGSGQDRLHRRLNPRFAGQAAHGNPLADPDTLGVAGEYEELRV